MSSRQWNPLNTRRESRPKAGQLLAREHAVWRVDQVEDVPLSDADREVWLDHGMPDLDTWWGRPYKVDVEWVGGAEPDWFATGDRRKTGVLNVPAGKHESWDVYPGERWPQCSCCGEPMPCRAELEDRQVGASLDRIARLEAIPPGACWACREPISARQKTVTYPGDNLDLPGAQQPVFHTRRGCFSSARAYEEKWLAADPRRERILTYPKCDGILVVHADGSSECVAGRDPLGAERTTQPDCQGHLTHDHSTIRACYVGERYFGPRWESGCPRGCDPEEHGGCATTRRPSRREPTIGGLFS